MSQLMGDLISGAFLVSVALGIPVCILFVIGYHIHRAAKSRSHVSHKPMSAVSRTRAGVRSNK